MTEEDVKKEQLKIIIINDLICLVGFLSISFLFFYNKMEYPLGLLFGTIVSSLYHWLLYIFSGKLLKQGTDVKKKALKYYFIRYFIFGLGLAICLILDQFVYKCLSWITYLVPFLTLYIVLIIVMKKRR